MAKIAVITANIGGIDSPKLFPKQLIDCDYFSFTDKDLPYPFHTLDSRLKAKYYKMLAHEILDHEILVWVDGNLTIKSQDFLSGIVDKLKGNDIAMALHPERTSIYQEADFIINQIKAGDKYLKARYLPDSIQKEVDFFRSKGVPEDSGLYWCGLFARRNDPLTNLIFKNWWDDNIKWSNFDQNSFVYRVHKHKLRIGIMDWGSFNDNDTYTRHSHIKLQ